MDLGPFVEALDAEFLKLAGVFEAGKAPPGSPLLDAAVLAVGARACRRFGGLIELYGLEDLSIAVLALALAPEIDRRYGDVLARLNGDRTRRAPNRSLLLDLLAADSAERAALLPRLAPTAPVFVERLLHLRDDAAHAADRSIVVDEQIRQMLLGEPGLDTRLSSFAKLSRPERSPAIPAPFDEVRRRLDLAVQGFMGGRQRAVRVLLAGEEGSGEAAASYLAALFGRPLLGADLGRLSGSRMEKEEKLSLLLRESILQGAIVWVRNAEAALSAEPGLLDAVRRLFSALGPVVVATGKAGLCGGLAEAAGFAVIETGEPDGARRAALWRSALEENGLDLPEAPLLAIAARYRLRAGEIAAAAAEGVAALSVTEGDHDVEATAAALCVAARRQGGHALAELTTRIVPRFGWDDIVLTEGVEQQVREMCSRAELSARVLEEWGFERKLSLGRGVTALFAGPPGTGKTMAAEVVANALGIDLFKVNLAGVVSKYIGETEQNLDRIFRAAVRVNGILLFDEADALFGKRSEVKDARDRYANLEISYLLQKMEEFDGIAILSTNLHGNLDDAFMRRLSFITYFPFPEPAERERLWQVVWPSGAPMEPIDFAAIAAAFKLSGGNIKQAALSAAYYAAGEGVPIGARHVLRGIEREFQKMGRPLHRNEIVPFSDGWRAAS